MTALRNVLACLLLTFTVIPARADAPETLSMARWIARLQATGAKFPPGATPAEKGANRVKFVDALAAEHNGVGIRFTSSVKSVRWVNGFAEVTISPEFRLPRTATPKAPLYVHRRRPFLIPLSQDQAVAIKPGHPFLFTGTLTFFPNEIGVSLPDTKHPHYLVSHKLLGVTSLGVFAATAYKITIRDIEYQHP